MYVSMCVCGKDEIIPNSSKHLLRVHLWMEFRVQTASQRLLGACTICESALKYLRES
jgi:hypothetical protein